MSEQKIRVWNRVGERMPPPHARYEVFCLSGKNLLATPCYGMHEPWWVPFADGKEGPPFAMEDRDEWREQEPAPTQAAPGDKALTGLDEFKQKLMAYADLDNTAAHSYLVITTLLAAATQRAEAADRDAKRLDWLLEHMPNVYIGRPLYVTLPTNSREAIDAAIASTNGAGGGT